MIRITKLSDYGTVILTHLTTSSGGVFRSARDIAQRTEIPRPMVSKILKVLVSKGLLVSHRGVNGGYTLARPSNEISLAEVIRALEGPIRITNCVGGKKEQCGREGFCPGHHIWPRINRQIEQTLEGVSLAMVAAGLSAQGS